MSSFHAFCSKLFSVEYASIVAILENTSQLMIVLANETL